MIISIRGTSGSGKSTLVRRLLSQPHVVSSIYPLFEQSRLVGHQCSGFRVVGPYYLSEPQRSCGVDVLDHNLRRRDVVFDLITRWATLGHVVYEGLLISNEVGRTAQQAQLFPTHIIFLDMSLDVCLERINGRRRAKAPNSLFDELPDDVSPKKTVEKYNELGRVLIRLTELGVSTYWLPFDDALAKCQELLRQ